MSILNYSRRKDSASRGVFLPTAANTHKTETIASANECIGDLASCEPAKKRRKTTQQEYDPKERAAIGKCASLHGPGAAVRHFTKLRGYTVPESMTKKFRYAYEAELKNNAQCSREAVSCVESLPTKPKGRLLLLGDLDPIVQD